MPISSKRRVRVPSCVASAFGLCATVALVIASAPDARAQGTPSGRTLVVVMAHADDETPAGPIFARYAREGARVYFVIATDGGQGSGSAGGAVRPDSGPRGEDLVRARAEEARCATQALGIQPPILLTFPDGKLGDYTADRSLLFRLTDRIAAELERLKPDAIVTWGPDGGTGHPDHRLVGDIVMQLQRAGAPGVPDRIFFMHIPAEGMRAMNPQRGAPPLLLPQSKLVNVHIPITPPDLDAARRAMACHHSQFSPETVDRVFPMQARYWNGSVELSPAFPTTGFASVFP